MRFEKVENSVARGSRHRMCLVREAVHEGARAALKCFHYTRRNQHGAERRITAGNTLPSQNHVRLDAPVLDCKRFSCAAHSGHDFVRNQKNAVLSADFRDAHGIAFRRHRCTKRYTDDWFEDESGSVGFLAAIQLSMQVVGARESALWERLLVRTVVAETRSDVSPFGEERFVQRAAGDIPTDGHRSKCAAVIA